MIYLNSLGRFGNYLFNLATALSTKQPVCLVEKQYQVIDLPIKLPPKMIKVINSDVNDNFKLEVHEDVLMRGFFQNLNNIDIPYIRTIFKPLDSQLYQIYNLYGDLSDYVCIHVRRTDYLLYEDRYTIPNPKWYIDTLHKYYPDSKAIIISDDIEWCKRNIKDSNIIYADKSKDFYIDFWIQTLTKANICSSSTFSLMGAILNKNENCVVPDPFFTEEFKKKGALELMVPQFAKKEKIIMEENKKVSVVITAYNVGKYIKQAIESVLNQTYKNIECIVVLDKPTDDTEKIVKSFGDNIKVIENKENVGPGLSRRYGIQESIGDYVLLLDGDDYLDNTFIESLYNRAVETDADIVSGGITTHEEDGSYTSTSYGNTTTEGYDKITKFWGERVVFMNNKLIKRKLHELVPYSHRRYIEDTPVIIPQMYYANKVVYVDSVGYHYRMRKESLTHSSNPIKDLIYKGLCWCDFMEFFNKHDKKVFELLPIKHYISVIFEILNKSYLTAEMIEPYKDDWSEFCCKLFNCAFISSIKLKEIKIE